MNHGVGERNPCVFLWRMTHTPRGVGGTRGWVAQGRRSRHSHQNTWIVLFLGRWNPKFNRHVFSCEDSWSGTNMQCFCANHAIQFSKNIGSPARTPRYTATHLDLCTKKCTNMIKYILFFMQTSAVQHIMFECLYGNRHSDFQQHWFCVEKTRCTQIWGGGVFIHKE